MQTDIGRILIVVGVVSLGLGLLLSVAGKIPLIGRLAGRHLHQTGRLRLLLSIGYIDPDQRDLVASVCSFSQVIRIKVRSIPHDRKGSSWEVSQLAMTKRDLFWRLFQSSGHVGAYLLYAWYQQPSAARSSDPESQGEPIDESAPLDMLGSLNGRQGEAAMPPTN